MLRALCRSLALLVLTFVNISCAEERHWLSLKTDAVTIGVDENLALSVSYGASASVIWQSRSPRVLIQTLGSGEELGNQEFALGDASERVVEEYRDGELEGYRIRLGGWKGSDATLTCLLALDPQGRLMVEVDQEAGKDSIQEITDLFSFALRPDPSAYMIVPRGSGYLIRSDSSESVSLTGFVGAAYSLPLFGLVQGEYTAYQIVDTWWDAALRVDHEPGQQSRVALDWKASLGRLNYARRARWVFDKHKDHVDVAKAYRKYVEEGRLLPTLQDRIQSTPGLKRFLSGIEYRVLSWEDQPHQQVLENIRRFQAAGLPVTFFHPKWPAGDRTPAGWQEYLRDIPVVKGGWPAARKLQEQASSLGCSVKFFVMPHVFHENAPYFQRSWLSGADFPKLSDRYSIEMLKLLLDHVAKQGLKIDALYFDGHAAHRGHDEHQSAEGAVSRRETYEVQLESFRESRRRGIVPGAELARFWAMGECDYFFFTDWSSDRLREGEPIPLFQLVFNDCYAAHFSGGGYYQDGKYDWYADRHPRLYELMYGAMPSHNWLPGGEPPIEQADWETKAMSDRLDWLRLWSTYFQAVGYVEMTSHRFLNDDRSLQRVEYANGAAVEFDLTEGRFRVLGIDGIAEDWQLPPTIEPNTNS